MEFISVMKELMQYGESGSGRRLESKEGNKALKFK